jgi:Protein of unknown function (DUF4240)
MEVGHGMDRDRFWMLIEAARTAGGDCEELTANLVDVLRELPASEIVAFQQTLEELLAESFRYTLWGAAVLINAGCSDDGFEDFRGWLIAQGRQVYEAALQDPDSLALHPQVRTRDPRRMWPAALTCQALLASACEAYEATTAKEFPSQGLPWPPRDPGPAWDFDDHAEMRRRYPKLWTRLGWDTAF